MPRARRRRSEDGSAIADFALVSVVLMPLFLGIVQLALIWHVKTTLASAASEGARYGAAYDRTAEDGGRRTCAVIDKTFGRDFRDTVHVREPAVSGQPGVEVDVSAQVPVLGFWGPSITVHVSGHAVKEVVP
jgi:Flp pilus assembly protein TadG